MDTLANESKSEATLNVLISMYEQSQLRRQHHESMRLKMTMLLLSIYTLLASVVAVTPKEFNANNLCFIFLACSIFGLLFTLSHTERANLYYRRGCVLRDKIDNELKSSVLKEWVEEAENYKNSKEKYRIAKLPTWLRYHVIWILLHGLVVVLAIWLCFESYNYHSCCGCCKG